jgi:lanosterol synthase
MPKLVSERRLCDSVDLMLSMQNRDGGFGSYGQAKGPQWLESLNPDSVFGEQHSPIMLTYVYTVP